MTRILTGMTADLYAKPVPTRAHASLQELREVLDELGFKVAKKAAHETTLRAYPKTFRRYPLLNPRFSPSAKDLDLSLDAECLDIAVLSKGQQDGLDQHLEAFPSTTECTYMSVGAVENGYYRHGHFVLPVHFSGPAGSEAIDFSSLRRRLADVWRHLQQT